MRTSPTLEARYFERMAAALGDKMRIVDALPEVTEDYAPLVLDVGAGGGEFSNALTELGYRVIALDASDDAVVRMREKFPKLTTAHMLANECDALGLELFDAVVCSSILHEVYSYGDNEHNKGEIASLNSALDAFLRVLKPGGKLIVRDGVKPHNWATKASVRVIDGSGPEPLIQYLEACPFSNGWIKNLELNRVQLEATDVSSDWFHGNLQSAYEFYMTYNWGVSSYPRETQELYGVLTLEEYVVKLEERGFLVESSDSWVQEGYLINLPKKVELITSEGVNCWPDTNALWVAHKP